MPHETYRIAIVGIGGIAEKHALAIADIPNASVVAGCCRTEAKGKKFADDFDCEYFLDVPSMLDGAKPDVVTICTPSGAHLEPTIEAAKRGIHVLCEKPLEITTERAAEMIKTAEQAGIVLGGIFPQRFNPVVQQVHQAAVAGRFGKLSLAVAYVPWWRDDEYYAPSRWQGTLALDGGGALMNQSIHAIDAMQWIAAATGAGPVKEIFGYTGKLGHDPDLIEVEDTAVAVLWFENGTLGNIVAGTSLWPGTSQRIHFAGRDGTAEVHENELVTWQFRNESGDDQRIRDQYGKKAAAIGAGGAADPMAIDYVNHTRNIEDFLTAVASKSESAVNASEACKSLAIIRGIYESVQTGQPVSL